MSYHRWNLGANVSLYLELVNSNGTGATGQTPTVMIRRRRNSDGSGFLDRYYWDGTGSFSVNPLSHAMTEVDATNNLGIYEYTFSQSLVQSASVYEVYYQNTGSPNGVTSEVHYFVTTGSDGTVNVFESEPS